jgi:DNA-binding transcriptional ArsR family regulator
MPANPPLLPLSAVQSTIGSPMRWLILRQLADGGSMMVSELAKLTGTSPSAMSKQLTALVNDEVVINPRGRLYQIDPRFIADPANRIVDFGWCLLRLNTTAPDSSGSGG